MLQQNICFHLISIHVKNSASVFSVCFFGPCLTLLSRGGTCDQVHCHPMCLPPLRVLVWKVCSAMCHLERACQRVSSMLQQGAKTRTSAQACLAVSSARSVLHICSKVKVTMCVQLSGQCIVNSYCHPSLYYT